MRKLECLVNTGEVNQIIEDTLPILDKKFGVLEEYTKEMEEILKNAPRDAEGYLLAPNGKRSNLTERQYAQVRTKAFKEWFGDWETIAYDKATLNSIPNLRKINVDSFLKAVDSRLEKDYLTTGYLNRESVEVIKKLFDLSKIQLYQGDIKEQGLSFYTGAIVLRTMTMEEAAQVFVHEVLHSYTTYAYDTDATFRKEINKYHKIALSHNSGFSKDVYEFMANTLEPGHMATLLEIPSENNSSNLLKDITNSLVKHIRAFFKIYETKGRRTLFHDVIETIYNHKRNNSESINNVSKVVDENGEPLVVYHYTDNENLTEFSTEFDNYFAKAGGTKKAIFFTTDNVIPGSEDNFLTSRKAKLSLFLNIKNLEIFNGTKDDLHKQGTSYREVVNKSSEREGSENGIVFTGFDDNRKENQTIYVVHSSNQIKSATDNIGAFSAEDDSIYKHLLHKDIISEKDYIEFLEEFKLSREKTDDFLYNFITKILQVNPRNKIDKSIPLTVQNYPTSNKVFINYETKKAIINRILGLSTDFSFDSETFEKDLKDYIENKWEKDLYEELIRLDKERLSNLDHLYRERAKVQNNISLLQVYLNRREQSPKEVLEYVESFKSTKRTTTSLAQHIGYELKKKKSELIDLDEKIKHYRFSNASRTLKVKNRLAALYNIDNVKELVFNRIKADRDSYKLPKEEWEKKIAPYMSLYEKAKKASKNAELLEYNNPIFENKKSLDEISVNELYNKLIQLYPTIKSFLEFIKLVNPKLKIKVYNTEDYNNLAEREDSYISGQSASIFFPRENEIAFRLNADTPTILHELLHSVSSYGLIGSSEEQKALGENVIQPFIDYIDNYLKQNVGNFGSYSIFGAKMPATIYGLTNPAEFIAELFSNKDFQELLDTIPPMEKKQYSSLLEEIIDSILNFVKNIFAPKTNETALDQAIQLSLAVIRTQYENIDEIYEQLSNIEDTTQKQILDKQESKQWGRYSDNGFEVSTAAGKNGIIGDSRFSAFNATFKPNTIIDGVDVGGKTIEYVYQNVIKKSGKGQTPSKNSRLYIPSVSSYTGNITPDANTIFVFGSNPEGRHGAGAAKIAREQFGAIYGQGEGLQGNAYALPTKDLRVTKNKGLRSISETQIIENIKKLYETAKQNPDKQFKVAYKNTDKASLNGYTGLEMIDMFLKAGPIPSNIVFSKEWVDTGKFNLSDEEKEDFSYTEGYLPLWQEWAKQNPELIEELREKSRGKILTDQFANTRVSQARALADILNSTTYNNQSEDRQIVYTPIGKTQQTYTIRKSEDGRYQIINKDGKEVFKEDSKDRRRIFANLAVKEGRAVVVNYKDKQYVVNNKNQIISVTTGDLMNWSNDNGDRKNIIELANEKFNKNRESSQKNSSITQEQKESIIKATISNIMGNNGGKMPTSQEVKANLEEKLNENKKDKATFDSSQAVDIDTEDKKLLMEFDNPQQIEDRANMLMMAFMDEVEYAYEDSDKHLSKQDFIVANFKKLIDSTFETLQFEIDDEEYDNPRAKRAYQQILDNKKLLFEYLVPMLYVRAGILISVNNIESISQDDDISQNGDNFGNDDGSDYTSPDGWMIKARKIDLELSLTDKVRKVLGTLVQKDRNGNTVRDDAGFERLVNPAYAHLKLRECFSSLYTEDEMDEALSELAKSHPWVNELIDKMNADASLKAAVWNNIYSELTPYWINVNGKTKQINKLTSVLYQKNEWRDNYESGTVLSDNSIYNQNGELQLDNVKKTLQKISDIYDKFNIEAVEEGDISFEDALKPLVTPLVRVLKDLGINKTSDDIKTAISRGDNIKEQYGIFESITKSIKDILTGISEKASVEGFDINTIDLHRDYDSAYTKIAESFKNISDESSLLTFKEGGNTYSSYSAMSFLGKMFNGIQGKHYRDYIDNRFKKYSQYFKGDFKDIWVKLLSNPRNKKLRENFERKVVLKWNNKAFENLEPNEYESLILGEYFSVPESSDGINFSYYYIPLLADSDSCEFVKFIRYDDKETISLEEQILPHLAQQVLNEFDRILLVEERKELLKKGKTKEIQNFDKQGEKFCLFPNLNDYEVPDSVYQKYSKRTNDTGSLTFLDALKIVERYNRAKLNDFITDVLRVKLSEEFKEFSSSRLADQNSKSPYSNNKYIDDLRSFFYNNYLAQTQIIRMTCGDLAYFKNLEDFYKRNKQIYAMTQRYYTKTKYGKKVTKRFTVEDIKMPARDMERLRSIVEKQTKSKLEADFIVNQFKRVNLTDAQSWRTLRSYRSAMDMAGRWESEDDAALERLENGTWEFSDFNRIWQTIKPFCYTMREVNSDVKAVGMLSVPTQFKNSEAILLALYDTISMGSLGKSATLKAVQRFMDKHNIDVLDFESAVKVGAKAKVNLSDKTLEKFVEDYNKKNSKQLDINDKETAVSEYLESTLYPNGQEDANYVEYINTEDMGIQVQTSEHSLDHTDIIGSQFLKQILADLPEDFNTTIGGIAFNKESVIELFQSLLSEKSIRGFNSIHNAIINKDGTVNYDSLGSLIKKEIDGNPRYSEEERKALTLITKPDGTKEFAIPLYDRVQSKRIQQLLFSIINKKTTRLTMRRASSVQASSWGVTDELNIRYKDENGNLSFSKSEWESNGRELSKEDKNRLNEYKKIYNSYEEYYDKVKADTVAYWECYLPAYSRDFLMPFIGKDGNLDITKMPESLKKAVGIRCPTEAKYSMQPLYIKGFLPVSMGSVVMLPAEITTVVGSDFDIDKMLIYLPEFKTTYNNEALTIAYLDENGNISDVENNTPKYKDWLSKNKYRFAKKVEKVEFDYTKPISEQSEEAINNAIIDIAFNILTNNKVSAEAINPGSTELATKSSRICYILKNLNNSLISSYFNSKDFSSRFKELLNMSKDELNEIYEVLNSRTNPLIMNTQVNMHDLFSSGNSMIAIAAVGSAQHAQGQLTDITVAPINILGHHIEKLDNIEAFDGTLESRNLSNLIDASVDNAKELVLSGLNINPKNGNLGIFLLRSGLSLTEMGIILGTKPINSKIANSEFGIPNKLWNNTKPVESYTLTELAWVNFIQNHPTQLKSESDMVRFVSVSKAFNNDLVNLTSISDDINTLARVSRGDGQSNSGGPTIGTLLYRRIMLNKAKDVLKNNGTVKEYGLLDFNFLLDSNYKGDILNTAKQKGIKNTYLNIVTKLGVIGPNTIIGKLFPELSEEMYEAITSKEWGLASLVDLENLPQSKAIKIIDKFIDEMYLYYLSSSNFYGNANTAEEKRNLIQQYIYEFPKYLKDMLDKYPELKDNSFIKGLKFKEANRFNPTPYVSYTTNGNLSQLQKIKIQHGWSMLVASENPEIQNLAFNLFRYSSLFGLTYTGPHHFSYLVSNYIRKYTPYYLDSLEKMKDISIPQSKIYINQFVRNHISELSHVISDNIILSKDDSKIILMGDTSNKKVVSYIDNETKTVNYYIFNGVYNTGSGKVTYYIKTTRLGVDNSIKEYYYGEKDINSVLKTPVSNWEVVRANALDLSLNNTDMDESQMRDIISISIEDYSYTDYERDANGDEICL